MPSPEYHRPTRIPEALELLQHGRALAGGTRLSVDAAKLTSIVDLQSLDLDRLEVDAGTWMLGASMRLQSLMDSRVDLPPALLNACRLEAGINLRNMATIGGTIITADGRSPLVTCLLAADARVALEPGGRSETLEAFLEMRSDDRGLLVSLRIPQGVVLAYEQVARSPADRPIVCVAAARLPGMATRRVALGGYGSRPILVGDAQAAAEAYARAEDAWSSAEYRSAIAGVLARRALAEVG